MQKKPIVLLTVLALFTACTPTASEQKAMDTAADALIQEEAEQPGDSEEGAEGQASEGYRAYTEGVIGDGNAAVLFFHAPWCGECRAHNTLLEKLDAAGNVGGIVYKVDYDTNMDLRKRYGVVTQNTFVQIDARGEKIDSISFPSDDRLAEFIRS